MGSKAKRSVRHDEEIEFLSRVNGEDVQLKVRKVPGRGGFVKASLFKASVVACEFVGDEVERDLWPSFDGQLSVSYCRNEFEMEYLVIPVSRVISGSFGEGVDLEMMVKADGPCVLQASVVRRGVCSRRGIRSGCSSFEVVPSRGAEDCRVLCESKTRQGLFDQSSLLRDIGGHVCGCNGCLCVLADDSGATSCGGVCTLEFDGRDVGSSKVAMFFRPCSRFSSEESFDVVLGIGLGKNIGVSGVVHDIEMYVRQK